MKDRDTTAISSCVRGYHIVTAHYCVQVSLPTNSVGPGGKSFIAKSDRSRDRERKATSESEVSVYIEAESGESRITWYIRQTWTVALLEKTLTQYKYDHTWHIRSHNDQTYNTHTMSIICHYTVPFPRASCPQKSDQSGIGVARRLTCPIPGWRIQSIVCP